MTIDEFMRDIAPKMRSGFVFYDRMGDWQYCAEQPEENLEDGWWMRQQDGCDLLSLQMFDIAPVDDWKKSKRKVGCDD